MSRRLSRLPGRVLSRLRPAPGFDTPPEDRPPGTLVWMHATSPGRLAAMHDTAARLRSQREQVYALITLAEAAADSGDARPGGAERA